jgi:hypothetical protein
MATLKMLFIFADWFGKCIFNAPTAFESALKCRRTSKPDFQSPLSQITRFAVKFKHPVIAFICALFQSRCPSTVLGAIIAVVVFAVKRMALAWAQSHISAKVFKRFSPTITDLDPSTAVVVKHRIVWVSASLNHRTPNIIFGRFTAAVSNTHFTKITTTRCCSTVSQTASLCRKFFAAIANTKKPCGAVCSVRFIQTNYRYFSESLSGYINQWHMFILSQNSLFYKGLGGAN